MGEVDHVVGERVRQSPDHLLRGGLVGLGGGRYQHLDVLGCKRHEALEVDAVEGRARRCDIVLQARCRDHRATALRPAVGHCGPVAARQSHGARRACRVDQVAGVGGGVAVLVGAAGT